MSFTVINKYAKDSVVQILTVFGPIYHVAVTSKKHRLWGSSLFENVQNLFYISKMQKKNSESVFSFRENCISIGCLKLSLLRREYFWPGVNVLTIVLRCCISLRETFLNSITFTFINKYCKGGVFQQCLVAFTMLLVQGFPDTGLIIDLPNHIFHSPHFSKYRSYESHLFSGSVQT